MSGATKIVCTVDRAPRVKASNTITDIRVGMKKRSKKVKDHE